MLLENDLTANTYDTMERDQNGEVSALIKVVTPENGFVFEGGLYGIVKTVQKTGEIWVYVPRATRNFTIIHHQYGVLRNYYFPVPIEGGRTYELVLETSGSTNDDTILINESDNETIMAVVDDQPEFPGGTAALLDYLRKNIVYPSLARENHLQGRVLVTFIVEKDGSITNVEIEKGVNPLLDAEAIRVVQSMPKWKCGKQKGVPVRVKYTVPVNFRLN